MAEEDAQERGQRGTLRAREAQPIEPRRAGVHRPHVTGALDGAARARARTPDRASSPVRPAGEARSVAVDRSAPPRSSRVGTMERCRTRAPEQQAGGCAATLSERLHPGPAVSRRAVRGTGHSEAPRAGARVGPREPRPRRPGGGRAAPRRDLPAAGDHVRDDRRGGADARAPVPARPRAARAHRRGVDDRQARARAAHPRAQPLRRRRLPRARDRARRDRALAARRQLLELRARRRTAIRPPGGVYCHVAGCDLVRDTDGTWRVLEDNVRTPSGISYVLENRVAMARLVPGPVRPLPRAPRRPLPAAAARRAALRRAVDRERGDGRRLDARAR